MRVSTIVSIVVLVVIAGTASKANAQRAGQSVTVRTGTVTSVKSVNLNDGNALGGALVGGAVGAALTRSSKGSGRRDRNAALGAVLGAGKAASKTQPGSLYTVTTNEGTQIKVATEQTEIRVDDCVFVEETPQGANIRRAQATACAPETQDVLDDPDVAGELREEAEECAAAKQQLIDADTDEAVQRALKKVQIFCYD